MNSSDWNVYYNGFYDEKPRLLSLESLKKITKEIAPLFKKAKAPLSFKGLEETYEKYAYLTNNDILGLHLMRCEFNAWVEYLETILIMTDIIKNNYQLKVDYLESLKNEQAKKFKDELFKYKKAIKLLEAFKKDISKHIKKINECDTYCKKLFNKQIRIYNK